jgi:hypothetical protein
MGMRNTKFPQAQVGLFLKKIIGFHRQSKIGNREDEHHHPFSLPAYTGTEGQGEDGDVEAQVGATSRMPFGVVFCPIRFSTPWLCLRES